MSILGVSLGLLIGLSLGLLGGGGSILTVPIFVYLIGFSAKQAIAMSLAVVGITSLVGAFGHWRIGNVHLRVAVIFGAVAMLGTYTGARLAAYVAGTAQLTLFALVMLAAALFMLRGSVPRLFASQRTLDPAERFRLPVFKIGGVALGVGALTGLVGVGGGFLIVPALVLLVKLPMKEAVGTSLLVITMNTASGFAGYLGQVEIAWAFMSAFTALAIAGIVVGTKMVRRVPQALLRRAFAVFLLIVATAILYENRSIFLPKPPPSSSTQPAAEAPFTHNTLVRPEAG